MVILLNIAIRLGEKVSSDLGYVLPSWVEGKVNRYLLHHGEEYAKAAEMIGLVNVSSIYKGVENSKLNDSYDIIDNLPFKGLEEVLDIKKFSQLVKHFNKI